MTKKGWTKLIVLLAVVVVVLILTFQNIEAKPFAILFWKRSLSPSIMMLLTFLLGIFGGMLLRAGRK